MELNQFKALAETMIKERYKNAEVGEFIVVIPFKNGSLTAIVTVYEDEDDFDKRHIAIDEVFVDKTVIDDSLTFLEVEK